MSLFSLYHNIISLCCSFVEFDSENVLWEYILRGQKSEAQKKSSIRTHRRSPKSNDEEAIVLIIAAILIVYLSFCIFITVDMFANDGRERWE